MNHWLDGVIEIMDADTCDLRELAKIAGGDPKTFYRGADMRTAIIEGQDLSGMTFTSSLPSSNYFPEASSQKELFRTFINSCLKHTHGRHSGSASPSSHQDDLIDKFIIDLHRRGQLVDFLSRCHRYVRRRKLADFRTGITQILGKCIGEGPAFDELISLTELSIFTDTYRQLGAALITAEFYKSAEIVYRMAVSNEPTRPYAYLGLAEALEGLGQINAAYSELLRARPLFPDNTELNYTLDHLDRLIERRSEGENYS